MLRFKRSSKRLTLVRLTTEEVQVLIFLTPGHIGVEVLSRDVGLVDDRKGALATSGARVVLASMGIMVETAPDEQVLSDIGLLVDHDHSAFEAGRQRGRGRYRRVGETLQDVDGHHILLVDFDVSIAVSVYLDRRASAAETEGGQIY